MTESAQNYEVELAAINSSSAVLSKLPDNDSRRRVLSYMLARYLPESSPGRDEPTSVPLPMPNSNSTIRVVERTERELPGVARLNDVGDLQITVRDLRAKSRLDAAVRLSKVAIYAHQRLTGQPLSSRKSLTPLLKEWRLYDGNTRSKLAKAPGIIRSGDNLSLDPQALRIAERFVNEICSIAETDRDDQRIRKWGPETHPRQHAAEPRGTLTETFDHIENWDNFTNKCSISIHTVNKDGIILWANKTELNLLGYHPKEYIGHFIGDFHLDADDVKDMLEKLIRFETVRNYPARMRAKDGTTKFVMINSNVYRQAAGDFGHSRCFTTEVSEAIWKALKHE